MFPHFDRQMAKERKCGGEGDIIEQCRCMYTCVCALEEFTLKATTTSRVFNYCRHINHRALCRYARQIITENLNKIHKPERYKTCERRLFLNKTILTYPWLTDLCTYVCITYDFQTNASRKYYSYSKYKHV